MIPASWKFTATVVTGPARDDNGDLVEGASRAVPGCLLGVRSSANPLDASALTQANAALYAPPTETFTSADVIVTPADAPLAGRWAVDGAPVRWPRGWEVPLRKE